MHVTSGKQKIGENRLLHIDYYIHLQINNANFQYIHIIQFTRDKFNVKGPYTNDVITLGGGGFAKNYG